jgi:hypothetical protein
VAASASRLRTRRDEDLVTDEEDVFAGAAGDEGAAAAADQAAGAEADPRDRAEEGFERGAAERAASRGDRREDGRFSRVLRDRAILAQQLAETQAQLAAERAQRAKDRADGYGVELTRAEHDVRAAVEAGDAEAIARANRRIAEMAANRTAASLEAQAAERTAAEVKARRPAAEEGGGPSETTAAWLEANGWYGRDARMTRQAQVLHQEAVEDEGLRPDTPAYWRFIESGLDQRFPGKVSALYARPAPRPAAAVEREAARGDEGEGAADPALAARVPARAASGAAPVSRAAAGAAGPGQTLRLSAEAVAVARSLGMTPQQYAARAASLAKQGRVNARNISGGA